MSSASAGCSVEVRAIAPIDRATSLSLIDANGAALFEGWSDSRPWRTILPWPERIEQLPWSDASSWRRLIDTIAPSRSAFRQQAPHPAPFLGGWIGFLSYEAGAALEGAMPREETPPEPPAWFTEHRSGIIVAADGRTFLFAPAGRIDEREAELRSMLERRVTFGAPTVASALNDSLPNEIYIASVERIRAAIARGDVYQVNLTRCLTARAAVDARDLYVQMTGEEPPRCSALIRGDGWAIVSASPEVFLRFDGSSAESRPIKGTISRRGSDDAEIAALVASEKDESEHLMIVDLVRNDFSKIAAAGRVSVPEYKVVCTLRHVHHLESTVRAEGLGGCTPGAIVEALFPAGSITGAPKRAAVEVIRSLEPVPRGIYTGAIGFFDHRGFVELSVAIRTAVVTSTEARYHAGGGIVWDSNAEEEDAESRAKSIAFVDYFRGTR